MQVFISTSLCFRKVVTISCDSPSPSRKLVHPWPLSSLSEPAGSQLLLYLQLLNSGDITSSLGPTSSGNDRSWKFLVAFPSSVSSLGFSNTFVTNIAR